MNSHPVPSDSPNNLNASSPFPQGDRGLKNFILRLRTSENRNHLIQEEIDQLRRKLQVDRIVVYYFYRQWEGQVTFESLSNPELSIYGSTGADDCFNDEYSRLYLTGRVRFIHDVETETISPCHREFLKSVQVRANLVVPILIANQLWGLLIAHQCQDTRQWSISDIEAMQHSVEILVEDLVDSNY